jgi:hypothetical protein
MERATKNNSPAKRSARKAADTATRKTPEARAAAKTRQTPSTKKGLLKAEFSEEAVKAVSVSLSGGDEARSGPNPGGQPSPGDISTEPDATARAAHIPRVP